MIARGDIWWADLGEPIGSAAGYVRPVIVVQADAINRSRIETVVAIPLTGNLRWAALPTALRLSAKATGLDRESVAQTTLILTMNKSQLVERVGRVSARQFDQLMACLDITLGR